VPTWLAIVIGVIVLVIVLMALGGILVNRRNRAAGAASFEEHVLRADHDLAAAHAADRGWARETLEQAARAALAERHPDADPGSVQLVQVIDMAGTDDDKAVFVADSGGRRHELTLGRRGDQWMLEELA
jgi:hypothetical protein